MMAVDVDLFFEQLCILPKALFMMDYDGTLAAFALERNKAFPYEGVRERIEQLQTIGKTKVVIVTGRPITDLLQIFNADPMPEIWGSHGGERLIQGDIITNKNPLAAKGLRIAKKVTLREIDPTQCEVKPLGLAIHWRGLEKEKSEILEKKAIELWQPLLKLFPLEVLPFHCGIELRQKGISKAIAVNAILQEEGHASVAYAGDDFTDEEAFAAIGNRGLKILISGENKHTLADLQFSNINELFAFMDNWLCCRSNRHE